MALKPIAQHIGQVAELLRLDARTLRRAIELRDDRRAMELATHIEAIASELAAAEMAFTTTTTSAREG